MSCARPSPRGWARRPAAPPWTPAPASPAWVSCPLARRPWGRVRGAVTGDLGPAARDCPQVRTWGRASSGLKGPRDLGLLPFPTLSPPGRRASRGLAATQPRGLQLRLPAAGSEAARPRCLCGEEGAASVVQARGLPCGTADARLSLRSREQGPQPPWAPLLTLPPPGRWCVAHALSCGHGQPAWQPPRQSRSHPLPEDGVRRGRGADRLPFWLVWFQETHAPSVGGGQCGSWGQRGGWGVGGRLLWGLRAQTDRA